MLSWHVDSFEYVVACLTHDFNDALFRRGRKGIRHWAYNEFLQNRNISRLQKKSFTWRSYFTCLLYQVARCVAAPRINDCIGHCSWTGTSVREWSKCPYLCIFPWRNGRAKEGVEGWTADTHEMRFWTILERIFARNSQNTEMFAVFFWYLQPKGVILRNDKGVFAGS